VTATEPAETVLPSMAAVVDAVVVAVA